MRLPGLIMSTLLTSILVACGGGGGGGGGGGAGGTPVAPPAPPPPDVPVAPPVLPPVPPMPAPVVPGATTITMQPQSQSVALAATVSFTVETNGPAPLGYQWLRNGAPIDGATARTYAHSAAQPFDNGSVYRVIVRTSAGQLESAPAMVTVPGAGMRMVAGGLEKERTFDPLFDTRLDVSAIATDAAGNVYASKGENLSRFSADATWTSLGAQACGASTGIAVDNTGDMYLACGWGVIKRLASGATVPFAGARQSSGNVDGAATVARFRDISAITIGLDGLMYVADIGSGTIRRIAKDGAVTTMAGGPRNGTSVDGTGAAVKFREMRAIVADAQGNVYVTDRSAVRKVTPGGVVTTLAGDASATAPGWTDGSGAAARFGNLFGIAIDASGHLYVADAYYHNVRKVTLAGVVTTLAGSHEQFGSSNGFGRFASFNAPRWLAMGAGSNLIVADYGNGTYRHITPAGVVTTLAGMPGLERSSGGLNGLGQEASLRTPEGLAIDTNGNLLVADSLGHSVRAITPAGEVSTLAGSVLVNGSADSAGALASFRFPIRVAPAGNGVVFVRDSLGDITTEMIRRIGADGVVSTIQVPRDPLSVTSSGALATEYNRLLAADKNGNYYVWTFAVGASYCAPGAIAPSCAGLGGRQTWRKIAPNGATVTILSGDALYPGTAVTIDSTGTQLKNMAVDQQGVMYFADITNKTVLKLTPAGVLSVLGGMFKESGDVDGPAGQARLSFPEGIAVDPAGNAYVIDGANSTIRKITPSGAITTLAGTPLKYTDPTGTLPGTLRAVKGIAVDAKGTVFITQENAILKIVQPVQ